MPILKYQFNVTGTSNIVRQLVKHGADIVTVNKNNDSALILAIDKGILLKVKKMFL